jgi:ComF family protein
VRLESLISLLAPPLCWGCGGRAQPREPLCGRCRAALRPGCVEWVDVGGVPVWAACSYEGPARALVAALKFRGAAGVAGAMTARMAALVELPGEVVLVPVPLHPARLRHRGYNQAERLAAALARRTRLQLADCLERAGADALPQVGRDRADRMADPSGRVRLGPGRAAPARALLVDDVVTTGATLRACARALHDTGSVRVWGVAFARTPGR